MSLTAVCQKRCFALQKVLGHHPNWSRQDFGGRAVELKSIKKNYSLGDEAALNA